MTKTYIVPCVAEISDDKLKSFWVKIGPLRIGVSKTPYSVQSISKNGVEIDFDKMEQLAKQNGEKFDREKFIQDFVESVRSALNKTVNGD